MGAGCDSSYGWAGSAQDTFLIKCDGCAGLKMGKKCGLWKRSLAVIGAAGNVPKPIRSG